MSSDLAKQKCVPCKGGVPPLNGHELQQLHKELDSDWKVVDEHHLEKTFRFEDFRQALDFTNVIGEIAEEQQHHPDIHLACGRVTVIVWTHKINGLSRNDFVLAARIDDGLNQS